MPYKTREQAVAISVSLGCPLGAHEVSGEWYPCNTPELYSSIKKSTRTSVKVPLSIKKALEADKIDIPKEGFTFDELHGIHEQLVSKSSEGEVQSWIQDVFQEFDIAKTAGESFGMSIEICKVDKALGLVIGWGIVCKKDDKDYFDTQGDHIPENAMIEASVDFMLNSRMAKDMHQTDGALPGSIVFAFPMTSDIAKAYGITTATTGLMIAMKPDSPEIMQKFASGEYTGFSIGGARIAEHTEYLKEE